MDREGAKQILQNIRGLVDRLQYEEAYGQLTRLDMRALGSPERGEAVAIGVTCLELLDRPMQADAELMKWMKAFEKDRLFLITAGQQFAYLEQFPFAERVLRFLCAMDPKDHEAAHQLGMVMEQEGRFSDAVRIFDHVIELKPDYDPSVARKAWCLREDGKLLAAVRAYREYLKLKPNDDAEWISLAIVESDLKNYDKAYDAYEKAKKINPDSMALYHNWSITAVRGSDYEKLTECAQKMAELQSEDWRTTLVQAEMAAMENQPYRGWELMMEAYELAGDQDDYEPTEFVAGTALGFLDEHDLADQRTEFIRRLFEDKPFSEDVLYRLRSMTGSRERGLNDYQVVVEGPYEDTVDVFSHSRQTPPDPGTRYSRAMRVFATDFRKAGDMALGFESRCGGQDLQVVEIVLQGQDYEDYPGVWSWEYMLHLHHPEEPAKKR